MTLRKRGLGRGLEALLVDASAKEEKYQPQTMQSGEDQLVKDRDEVRPPSMEIRSGAQTEEVDSRTAMVVELFKNIQREHLILLEEAEALRKLIEEFESIVRADLS